MFFNKRNQGREDRSDLASGYARSRQAQGQGAFGSIPSLASTFDCPCCNVTRLGRESLLQHVITHHQGTNLQVVSPFLYQLSPLSFLSCSWHLKRGQYPGGGGGGVHDLRMDRGLPPGF